MDRRIESIDIVYGRKNLSIIIKNGIIKNRYTNKGEVWDMKKKILGLVVATSLMASVVMGAQAWQYNEYTKIDLNSARVAQVNGSRVLTFSTVETIGDSYSECDYVYDIDNQTIQLKKMTTVDEKKKLRYTSNFNPLAIEGGNKVIQERADMANAVLEKIGK